jgi:hypothetical protein
MNVNSVFTRAKAERHVSVSGEDENVKLVYASDFDFMSSDSKECVHSHRSTCVNNSYDTVSDSKIQVGRGVGL